MRKSKFPCGRTEEDQHLCCRREHRWYNTKLVIERVRLCKNPIKRKQLFAVQSTIYCRYCGSAVEMAAGCSLLETVLEYIFGPWL